MSIFNFNSQICTNKNQSERLLALGLKKETSDMCLTDDVEYAFPCPEDDRFIPAWSLDRLRKLFPVCIPIEDDYGEEWNAIIAFYQKSVIIESEPYWTKSFDKDNLYDNIIDCIEWLIKKGYFNKKYLV